LWVLFFSVIILYTHWDKKSIEFSKKITHWDKFCMIAQIFSKILDIMTNKIEKAERWQLSKRKLDIINAASGCSERR
jgi:hypothetical protein